ncbi:MAG TPA: nucleotidyltransferase family protein [Trueperaceae bacterium]
MLVDGLDRLLVGPDDTLRHVVETIDRAELQLALVVDEGRRLLGVVSDGDVRRALLRGVALEDPAREVMNPKPLTVPEGTPAAAVEALMKRTSLRRIPVVDASNRVLGLAVPQGEAPLAENDVPVVIMAGGLGTRLAELTRDRPKPLLPVGAKPLLETMVERLVLQGFTHIYMSVNYKADMIEGYFGDGSRYQARIEYVHEHKRLGTAGALQYVSPVPGRPILVMNGDVLTTIDFRKLVDFHTQSGVAATMAVSYHDVQVPYGVVETSGPKVVSLVEKPVYRYFVNAGIYVLEPLCIQYLEPETYTDMTTLFERLLKDGREVASFPIHEYWQDVGRPADYARANEEYERVFSLM